MKNPKIIYLLLSVLMLSMASTEAFAAKIKVSKKMENEIEKRTAEIQNEAKKRIKDKKIKNQMIAQGGARFELDPREIAVYVKAQMDKNKKDPAATIVEKAINKLTSDQAHKHRQQAKLIEEQARKKGIKDKKLIDEMIAQGVSQPVVVLNQRYDNFAYITKQIKNATDKRKSKFYVRPSQSSILQFKIKDFDYKGNREEKIVAEALGVVAATVKLVSKGEWGNINTQWAKQSTLSLWNVQRGQLPKNTNSVNVGNVSYSAPSTGFDASTLNKWLPSNTVFAQGVPTYSRQMYQAVQQWKASPVYTVIKYMNGFTNVLANPYYTPPLFNATPGMHMVQPISVPGQKGW
jgi:hypothetical protein